MSITIVDQSPELFWFIRGLLQDGEVPIRHIKTAPVAKLNILQEFPNIVIINADDKAIGCEEFIKDVKGNIFFGDTKFIVVTGDSSIETTKNLLLAGASQILYRTKTDGLLPEYCEKLIKWFLEIADPSPKIFDSKLVTFETEAELTSYGRMNWLSPTHCLIESDIDLRIGYVINVKNLLFEELEIKNVKLKYIEKNKIGRNYNLSFSYLCKIDCDEPVKAQKKIQSWIKQNYNFSKYKSVKILFCEDDFELQENLQKLIENGERYVARGTKDLEKLKELLEHELPQLIFIKRELIQKQKDHFENVRGYLRNHFGYCITYSDTGIADIEEFKKTYDFGMHIPKLVDSQFLESMVRMLEKKLPADLLQDDTKFYINKKSIYSRFSLHDTCKITGIDTMGIAVELPFEIHNFGMCEIAAHSFFMTDMSRNQYLRIFNFKKVNEIKRYRMIFLGQTSKTKKTLTDNLFSIEKVGYDKWLKGER